MSNAHNIVKLNESQEFLAQIINATSTCVFWKDLNRRFLGVNQAFLNYYGFPSVDVLLGKTDEEMGWHSDPDPLKMMKKLYFAARALTGSMVPVSPVE